MFASDVVFEFLMSWHELCGLRVGSISEYLIFVLWFLACRWE